jgi:hypothetical protein
MSNADPEIWKHGIATQFSKTNRPKNPGRKKGQKNFATIFKRYLNKEVEWKKKNEDGTEDILKIPAWDAIVIKAIEKAIREGDNKIVEMIMNRVDGLPTQAIKQLNTNPLQIVYTPKNAEELHNQENFETNIKDEKDEKDETNPIEN